MKPPLCIHRRAALLLTLLCLSVVSHGAAPAQRLRVVTTFLPLQAHTLAIAQDHAEVHQLLARDTGPHDYQLAPNDVRRLASADLLIINGAGLEGWLDDLVAAAGNPRLRVVDTSASLPALEETPALEAGPSTRPESGETAPRAARNPHFWLDPVLARSQAEAILHALVRADPAHAEAYEQAAAAYFARLTELHQRYQSTLDPLENRQLITLHDAFPYLARRYSLRYLGFIAAFPEQEPSPAQLVGLVRTIRENRVGVLFAETGYAPDLLQRLAQETGARVVSLDTLEVGTGDGGAYLRRMDANLEALRRALSVPDER